MKLIKGFFKFIIGLVILVVVIVAVMYFLISTPAKEVKTEYTIEDFQSYLEKGGIDFDDSHASAEDFFADNVICSGQVTVDTVVTNAELTAVANMAFNDNSVMKDVNIKCLGNDELEASCVIGDLTPLISQFPVLKQFEAGLKLIQNKPVYMKSTLFYDQSTGLFDGVTEELYVGRIKIPVNTANDSLRPGGTALNDAIKKLDGFSVNEFKVTSDGFQFDGTIPEKISSAGSFDDLASGF
ncbi:MAG: hypothetical protein JXQ23_12035 [Clostridia bacterium]|nr:hypothetical protein [Clostridia bacterium]